jgi:hypothetical protein
MTTKICPACGYPTLGPGLCAFCRPGEAFSGDQVWGPMTSQTTVRRASVWTGTRDAGVEAPTDPIVLGPLAS